MAMIFMDGFDANDLSSKWSSVAGGATTVTTTRFNTGRSVSISNYFWALIKSLPTPANTLYAGFAIYATPGGSPGSDTYYSVWGDGGTVIHLKLMLHTNTQLRISRGDNTVLASSPLNSFLLNQWNFVEVMTSVADTGGRAVVRINGEVVIDFTGDTKNGGVGTITDTIRLGEAGGNTGPRSTTYFDDLYLLDNTGSTNNNFLGDVRIHTLPVTGAGTDTQLTPTGSATNWQNIEEMPAATTDYNSSSTIGQRDTYTHQDVPTGVGTIHSVQTNLTLAKSDAGAASIKPVVRSGGSVYYDPTINLVSSPVLYTIPHDVDPATSAPWTVSNVNGMESGVEVA